MVIDGQTTADTGFHQLVTLCNCNKHDICITCLHEQPASLVYMHCQHQIKNNDKNQKKIFLHTINISRNIMWTWKSQECMKMRFCWTK